uniref:CHCH domain-containing protein n=1 Tax=Elaeophora elaphi TaxID=1147741 RepID=A0A0R3S5U4_9BILA
MQFTLSLWKSHFKAPIKTNLARNDQLQFKEFLPLKSTNYIMSNYMKPRGDACTKELQALFDCLKKWEHDNLPCADFNRDYMDCVSRTYKANKELAAATEKVMLDGTTDGKTLTKHQMNNLMAKHPQPQLGQYPYKALKRLPNQSYADDIFHRKKRYGKAN